MGVIGSFGFVRSDSRWWREIVKKIPITKSYPDIGNSSPADRAASLRLIFKWKFSFLFDMNIDVKGNLSVGELEET